MMRCDNLLDIFQKSNYSPRSAYREHRDMPGKKQITAKSAK